MKRRDLLRCAGGLAAASLAGWPFAASPAVGAERRGGRVLVVGGGFAGASCARCLRRLDPGLQVTLVEARRDYAACPGSNAVIAGLGAASLQRFGYGGLAGAGITVIHQPARAVDAAARQVELADGTRLGYERLVVAPGIALRRDALPGYDEAAAEVLPHAWQAGPQTLLLRRQLQAMDDGGLVIVAVPDNPYRCPPGPYERASLIAHYLQRRKPRSKLLLLDAKDAFSKQKLFQSAWQALYPGMLEWVGLSAGGKLVSVDAATRTLVTEFGRHQPAVANVIPPQQAGALAGQAGLTDQSGWCPVDPQTFESRLQPAIHVIGDAAIAGAMPKSAFAANAQAKCCAAAIVALLAGDAPPPAKLINTCYSLVAPDYGISVAGVYAPVDGRLAEVAGGLSPLDAPAARRASEARHAAAWLRTITAEVFG